METKKSLKKFFLLMILWLVAIVAVFLGSFLYDHFKSSEYDAAAALYIKEVVTKLSGWDPATTRALMAPEVSATIPQENFEQAMALFSRLGTHQGLDTPKFEGIHKGTQAAVGEQTIVEYNVDAEFSGGDATINLKLLSRNGTFEIYYFNFSSKALGK